MSFVTVLLENRGVSSGDFIIVENKYFSISGWRLCNTVTFIYNYILYILLSSSYVIIIVLLGCYWLVTEALLEEINQKTIK